MSRPPVSVIVLADSWASARPCLDRLRPRLGLRDEIVLAIADEFGADPANARRYAWVHVVSGDAENVITDAVAATAHDLVVFLDPAAAPTGHWLDALLAPFAEDVDVVAAGPRLGGFSGAQGVEMDAGLDTDARRQFARAWTEQHRGQVTETTSLAPACLAVSRAALVAAGGFGVDLCGQLTAAGGRLVVAHGAFVDLVAEGAPSAAGSRRARQGPLVSACMIVRDEQDNLPACLASIGELVDEIVVYDTGSADATVEVAHRAGAVVVEGTWNDDFAAARNEALAFCSGEWILWVDADEVLRGDLAAFRAVLEAGSGGADRIQVTIENLDGDGAAVGYAHQAVRVFRRERAHWAGRLHEEVVARPGRDTLRDGFTHHVHLLHSGYRDEAIAAKGKRERNIRLGEAELAEGTERASRVLIHLGRSLWSAGRLDEALARFEEALARTEDPSERRLAFRHGAEALLDSDRPQAALAWIDGLREESEQPEMADYLEAIARAALGDTDAAIACLADVAHVRDDDGFAIADHVVGLRRALLLRDASRWADAADQLFAIATPATSPPWGLLTEMHWRAARDPRAVARAIPEAELTAALGQILAAEAEAADGVIDALFHDAPGDPAVLAAAAALAADLPVDRALEWSARLRRAGLSDRCPLLAIAGDAERSTADRLQATSVMCGAFGDERARDAVVAVAPDVPEADLLASLVQLGELAPSLLADFIVAAATDQARSMGLARALDFLGASEQAEALRRHGLELSSAPV